MKNYRLRGEVWLYPSETAAWHFVSVERNTASDIKRRHGRNAKGFGSLPVRVTIGSTTWETSIFPDSKSGTYLLPLKASVRRTENIRPGDRIVLTLALR